MLYLLKDSEDLEKACQRFLINNNEIKILEDYINIKKILNTNQKNFNHLSPSSWTEFIEDRNLNDETVKLSCLHISASSILIRMPSAGG